jgi:hypothetical protein
MAQIDFKCAEHTAQPHTLAAFLPWGSFAGAGRPARRKGTTGFWKNKFIPKLKLNTCKGRLSFGARNGYLVESNALTTIANLEV